MNLAMFSASYQRNWRDPETIVMKPRHDCNMQGAIDVGNGSRIAWPPSN